ncbi:MAG: hypothetical protein NW223_19265 [Hyphomicrobiaceae bacterium]|nr:hypothetical protein [Hyphomicrobiaceae bacterium]
MRTILGALVLAAGLLAPQLASATPAGGLARDAGVPGAATSVQYWHGYGYGHGGYCARLRRACEYKHERGEEGQGNCRRYRAECGSGPSYCERLRRACEYKHERGEEGQGNCRRYRAECGRGRW